MVAFCLDEFVELPQDHPQSQATYMWTNLGKVNAKRENVNILDGNADDQTHTNGSAGKHVCSQPIAFRNA